MTAVFATSLALVATQICFATQLQDQKELERSLAISKECAELRSFVRERNIEKLQTALMEHHLSLTENEKATLLLDAVMFKPIDALRLFLIAGFDPNSVSKVLTHNAEGTPYVSERPVVAYCRSAESMKLMLLAGADPKKTFADKRTAAHLIAIMSRMNGAGDVNERARMLLMLKRAGADFGAKDAANKTVDSYIQESDDLSKAILSVGGSP